MYLDILKCYNLFLMNNTVETLVNRNVKMRRRRRHVDPSRTVAERSNARSHRRTCSTMARARDLHAPRSDSAKAPESRFFGVRKRVWWDGDGYAARFPPNKMLGVFPSAEAAAQAYDFAARSSAGNWPVNFPRGDELDGTCVEGANFYSISTGGSGSSGGPRGCLPTSH
jgi:hypothetical protein